jgi:hypothetical protein
VSYTCEFHYHQPTLNIVSHFTAFEFSGFHSGVDKVSVILGCEAESLSVLFPTFHDRLLVSTGNFEMELPSEAASQRRRTDSSTHSIFYIGIQLTLLFLLPVSSTHCPHFQSAQPIAHAISQFSQLPMCQSVPLTFRTSIQLGQLPVLSVTSANCPHHHLAQHLIYSLNSAKFAHLKTVYPVIFLLLCIRRLGCSSYVVLSYH